MELFENYDRKIDKINKVMSDYGISSLKEAQEICKDKGINPYEIVKETQKICFEDACFAYTLGAAIAIKKNCKSAVDAAKAIGEGLQAFCFKASVAEE